MSHALFNLAAHHFSPAPTLSSLLVVGQQCIFQCYQDLVAVSVGTPCIWFEPSECVFSKANDDGLWSKILATSLPKIK
jgi:hypothetical protein